MNTITVAAVIFSCSLGADMAHRGYWPMAGLFLGTTLVNLADLLRPPTDLPHKPR